VVITGETSRAQIFKTLVHEIAHAILHGNADHHARSEMEVEAESTAFVVCQVLGLETGTYSFPYVASWAGEERAETMVLQSGQRIVRATNRILDALCGEGERLEDSAKGAA
jgi:antirestriction protein ArdC